MVLHYVKQCDQQDDQHQQTAEHGPRIQPGILAVIFFHAAAEYRPNALDSMID